MDQEHSSWNSSGLSDVYRTGLVITPCIASVITVINVVSIIAIRLMPSEFTSWHRLVLSLAVSDMLIGLSSVLECILFIAISTMKNQCEKETSFLISLSLFEFAILTSMINMLALTVEQFISIFWPLHKILILTSFRIKLIIVFIWLIPFMVTLSMYGLPLYGILIGDYKFCEVIYHYHRVVFMIELLLKCSLCAFTAALYLIILCKVNTLRAPSIAPGSSSSRVSGLKVKTFMTSFLLIGTSLLFFIPFLVVVSFTQSALAVSLSYWWGMLNSIANPMIYGYRVRDIRGGYYVLFSKMKKVFIEDMNI